MISLEDKRKQLKLSLKELGMAVMSLGLNPNADYEITSHEAKRLMSWYEGYTEANAILGGA
ncbi:hypothetical protein [Limosilactobacillus antri]|uniref:hypothetical protein n=1 Tax=Limosilactobacillus antri TaxID=227943 RepID=UPI001F5A17F4|nr:hypothetical protein [Limosilactobacillus antri]